MIRQQFLIGCFAGVLAACSQGSTRQETSSAADETAIRSMASAYTAAIAAGDSQRFLSFFTDDVVIMPPDQPAVRGREAFTAFATPLFDQFTAQETFSYIEIRVAGDWAVGTHTYTLTMTPKAGGATTREQGKGVVLLRRMADGSWKFTHAIWNQDQAATPPTPSS